jgi:hypothetical protein
VEGVDTFEEDPTKFPSRAIKTLQVRKAFIQLHFSMKMKKEIFVYDSLGLDPNYCRFFARAYWKFLGEEKRYIL